MSANEAFDRLRGALYGVPGVDHTKPTTIQHVTPVTGESLTFIVETYRRAEGNRDERGDTIFLQCTDGTGNIRVAIPPRVAEAISRQREALSTKIAKRNRSEAAKARMDAGHVPFQRKAG